MIHNARGDSVTNDKLTEPSTGFGAWDRLNDGPLIDHLRDGEQPHYIISQQQKSGITVRNGDDIRPDGKYRTMLTVTDRRVIFTVGGDRGDSVTGVDFDSVREIQVNVNDQGHTPGRATVTIETEECSYVFGDIMVHAGVNIGNTASNSEEIRAAADYVASKAEIRNPVEDTPIENTGTGRVETETLPDDAVHRVEGANGQVTLFDNRLEISREDIGMVHKVQHGFKGDKEIPYESLTSIQFRKPSSVTRGYIQFGQSGYSESDDGLLDATSDENTVLFDEGSLSDFEDLRRKVRELKNGEVEEETDSMDGAMEKLRERFAAGEIDEEEFQRRKEVLQHD